jgi:hypothetical protein
MILYDLGMSMRTSRDLSHDETAVLVREYLMAGHMIDRAGVPYAAMRSIDAFADVAIDEWMGASPIYTKRMQRLLGFDRPTVEAAMKGMQLEIGAPPEYLDFRMRLVDDHHGEFENMYCGALVELEPAGDEMVNAMCHRIQDPTFDATAWATHPKMRLRPIHRPPRVPADRVPHCAWSVVIDESIEDAPPPEPAVHIGRSKLATLPLAIIETQPGDGDGMTDYSGPLVEVIRLRDFAQATLRAIADEVAVQGHLLVLSFGDAVEKRFGTEDALDMVSKCFTGTAGVAARRIKRSLDMGTEIADVATMFELHPAFHPRTYVDWTVELDGDQVHLTLGACPAAQESGFLSWMTALADGHDLAIHAIAAEVDPHWRVSPAGSNRWTVRWDDEPLAELAEVALPAGFTATSFVHIRT